MLFSLKNADSAHPKPQMTSSRLMKSSSGKNHSYFGKGRAYKFCLLPSTFKILSYNYVDIKTTNNNICGPQRT